MAKLSVIVALASQVSVVKRSLRIALVVGCILIAINHGHAILAGDLGWDRLVRMALTFFVPYAVSTYSSVGAIINAKSG